MTFSIEIPRAPIPMSPERREQLRIMAESEAKTRAMERPARVLNRKKRGTRCEAMLNLLRETGEWFTTAELVHAVGYKAHEYANQFLQGEVAAGRLEFRVVPNHVGTPHSSFKWKGS